MTEYCVWCVDHEGCRSTGCEGLPSIEWKTQNRFTAAKLTGLTSGGSLVLKISPVKHHCTLYVWDILAVDESIPLFTDLSDFAEVAGGDSVSFDNDEAIEECKSDIVEALARLVACPECDSNFNLSREGGTCLCCDGAGVAVPKRLASASYFLGRRWRA